MQDDVLDTLWAERELQPEWATRSVAFAIESRGAEEQVDLETGCNRLESIGAGARERREPDLVRLHAKAKAIGRNVALRVHATSL